MSNVDIRISRPLSWLLTSCRHPPASDNLFQHLSLVDLIRVSRTCKGGYNAVYDYNRRAFYIDRLLGRFFGDPRAFRALQARTGTLISGSQALQFFSRTYWPESDLDLYTCNDYASTFEVGQWIQGQGYYFTPHSYQNPDFSVALMKIDDLPDERLWDPKNPVDVKAEQLYCIGSISSIYAFEKRVPGSTEVLKIQIIVGRYSPLQIILEFHSTAVMNFISWNKAYSLYPYATLDKRRSLSCLIPERRSVRSDEALIKYNERGFTLVAGMYPHEDPRCAFHAGPRFVGDKYACVMSLGTEGVEWSTKPHLPSSSTDIDPYLSNGWELKRRNGGEHPWSRKPPDTFQMVVKQIRTAILRHKYMAPPAFVNHVVPFIVGQGTAEHMKLSSEEAEKYAGRTREKPKYWQYYDAEYAEIIRQWIRDGMPGYHDNIDG